MPQSTLLASGIILKLWHLKDICAYKEYIDTSQHSFILLYPRHSYRSFPFNGIKDNAIFEIFRNQILRLKKKKKSTTFWVGDNVLPPNISSRLDAGVVTSRKFDERSTFMICEPFSMYLIY